MAISVENRKFSPPPCILRPCWRDSPWNCVSALGVKKTRMMWRYGIEKEVWRYLPAVWIQSTNVTDGQTDEPSDRHRATAKTALTHSVARLKQCDGINSQYKAAMPLSSKFSRKRSNEQQCNHFDISSFRHSKENEIIKNMNVQSRRLLHIHAKFGGSNIVTYFLRY